MKTLRPGSDIRIQWSRDGLFLCDATAGDSSVLLTVQDFEALRAELARVKAMAGRRHYRS
jgi:hypothetical protein